MENDLKINYIDPEKPINNHPGLRKYISKEEALEMWPDNHNQPERSKREDLSTISPMPKGLEKSLVDRMLS